MSSEAAGGFILEQPVLPIKLALQAPGGLSFRLLPIILGRYTYFGIAAASNPYSLSILWPSGDKIYIASFHASFEAPFLTKRP